MRRLPCATPCALQSVAPDRGCDRRVDCPIELSADGRAEVRVVEAEPRRPNVLASARGRGTGPVLLVNDHMDTVPAGPRDEWSVDPFGAVLRDGWVWGRGAVDSKGGLCSMVMATEIFLAAGGPARGELLMTAVCDEEVGSRLGTRYLLQQGLIRGDFGIVCEPTGNRIECAAKGVLHVEIMTKGRMAHGGKPWAGLNAISHMGARDRGVGRLWRGAGDAQSPAGRCALGNDRHDPGWYRAQHGGERMPAHDRSPHPAGGGSPRSAIAADRRHPGAVSPLLIRSSMPRRGSCSTGRASKSSPTARW